MKSKISKIAKLMIAFSLVAISLLSGFVYADGFTDLSPKHWCYEKIMKFLDKDYVCGYDDGTFRADRTITRAEYVKIVNNFFGYPVKEDTSKLNFSDVSGDEWFAGYVAEAVERGYITGYPDGTFRPQDPIRRQESTVILSKILDIDEEVYPKDHEDGMAQYSDADEMEDWAYVAIHSYSVYNFINGYPDGTIRLLQNVTRAETVELLNLLDEKIVIDREDEKDDENKPSGGSRVRYAFYYSDGEEITDYRAKVTYGKTTLVKAMGLEKEGYYFDGWNLRGTNQIYQPGMSTEKMTKDLIFDAIWKEIWYDVSYDAAGGTNAPSGESVRWNEEYVISEKVPVSGDLAFVGWKDVVSGDIYVSKEKISNVLRDYDFKALWTKLGITVQPDENTVPSGENNPGQETEEYELTADSITMYVGEIEKLIAKLNPEHSETEYVWSIVDNNDGNIELSGDGTIKALATTINNKGKDEPVEIKVTATTSEGVNVERKVYVTVLDREVSIVTPKEDEPNGDGQPNDNIDVLTEGISLYIGEEKEMTLSINPNAKVKEIKWNFTEGSTNAQIVGSNSGDKVVIEGLVVTEKNEPAKIEVTVEINGVEITKEVEVTVLPIEVIIHHDFPEGSDEKADFDSNYYLNSKSDSIDVMSKVYSGDDAYWYDDPTLSSGDSIINYESGSYEATLEYERLIATITFNGNGADAGKMEPQEIKVGAKENLNANKFSKVGYEFIGWTENADGTGKVIKNKSKYEPTGEDLTIDLYAKWEWAPNVKATIKATNYSNDAGKRAEPGDEIIYVLTITNDGEQDLNIDELSFGKDVTIVSGYDTVIPADGGEVKITLKKKVPSEYSVNEEFEITGEITLSDDEGSSTKKSAETSNMIEKSISVLSKEPTDKNIVIALDLSGSMEYCFTHEEHKLHYRYSPTLVGNDPKEFFFIEYNSPSHIIVQPNAEDGYYYSGYTYVGHEYKSKEDSTDVWHQCNEKTSRLDVAKVALIQLLTDLFEASEANGEKLNIQLIGFTDEALAPVKLTKDNYESKVKALKAIYNTGMNDALNDSMELIEEMANSAPKAENYFMFFGDGLKTDGNVKVDFSKFKSSFDYIYPVGLGASFSKGAAGYESLKDFAKSEEDIIVALNSDEVLEAFDEITSKIINKMQSVKGEVKISLENSNYFPVVVTHEVDSKDVTLFEITTTKNNEEVTWNDGVTKTKVVATAKDLIIDFSGTNFSNKENLKVKLGSSEPVVVIEELNTGKISDESISGDNN